MRMFALAFLLIIPASFSAADTWQRPRPVKESVSSMDAKFDQVWAIYKYEHPNPSGAIGWSEQITSDTVRKLRILDTLLSPARDRYFYVEVMPSVLGIGILPHYDEGPLSSSGLGQVDWNPTKTAMRVHVHRLSGEEVATINVPVSYYGQYAEGRWLGETWISLHARTGKQWGNQYTLFVNVETGERRLVGLQISGEQATDDGRFVVFNKGGALFVNFRPVYPYRGERLPDFGQKEGWEAYREKYFVRKETRPWRRFGENDLRVIDFDLSPDGESAVVLAGSPTAKQGNIETDAYGRIKYQGTHAVVLDLEKTENATTASDYTQTTALPRPAIRLQRDDKAAEFRVADDKGKILWRRPFSDKPTP